MGAGCGILVADDGFLTNWIQAEIALSSRWLDL